MSTVGTETDLTNGFQVWRRVSGITPSSYAWIICITNLRCEKSLDSLTSLRLHCWKEKFVKKNWVGAGCHRHETKCYSKVCFYISCAMDLTRSQSYLTHERGSHCSLTSMDREDTSFFPLGLNSHLQILNLRRVVAYSISRTKFLKTNILILFFLSVKRNLI